MQPRLSELLASVTPLPKPRPADAVGYQVRRIPEATLHFFGRDSSGLPCLLLSASDEIPKAPLILAGIEVRFSIPCQIALPGQEEEIQTLTTVLCTTQDRVLQDYFVHICETIIAIVGPQPTFQRVVDSVYRLVDLFQRLARPSSRSVKGLFAELYVIHCSSSPCIAVEAWHSRVDERFDFSIGDVRLEVKAAGNRQRVHQFSLEQCEPPQGTCGILISLFVETSGGGLSLLELVERIEEQLDSHIDLIVKLQETVADSLGTNAPAALRMRFDAELVGSSLQVYDLDEIPTLRGTVPPEVSRVHFHSDISRIQPADTASILANYRYARSLLPLDS